VNLSTEREKYAESYSEEKGNNPKMRKDVR
jgi:hypothetical protein